jgi:hypothetical protein
MGKLAVAISIRTRLRQHALPRGEVWRRVGEYSGGCECDACGERITSAQASYSVDFNPGVTPPSARFHRACFEIWQFECSSSVPVV